MRCTIITGLLLLVNGIWCYAVFKFAFVVCTLLLGRLNKCFQVCLRRGRVTVWFYNAPLTGICKLLDAYLLSHVFRSKIPLPLNHSYTSIEVVAAPLLPF